MSETTIKGLKELNDFLQQLPVKIERNVLRGALRAGMNEVKPVAAARINSISGELARGLKVGTKAKGGTVYANLKATGKHRSIAHLVEYGTKPHVIKGKLGGSLFIGGIFTKQVMHPGARPHPFMRPALDSESARAVVAAAEYMRKRLATKHGLDTADIVIEAEE